MLYILSLFINNTQLFSVFSMIETSVYASFIFFSILYTPINIIVSIIFNYISRNNEYSADLFSSKTTMNPNSLISGVWYPLCNEKLPEYTAIGAKAALAYDAHNDHEAEYMQSMKKSIGEAKLRESKRSNMPPCP